MGAEKYAIPQFPTDAQSALITPGGDLINLLVAGPTTENAAQIGIAITNVLAFGQGMLLGQPPLLSGSDDPPELTFEEFIFELKQLTHAQAAVAAGHSAALKIDPAKLIAVLGQLADILVKVLPLFLNQS